MPSATDPAVDARLRQARSELLGGRGPGASPAEIAAHTRNRMTLAGQSTTARLQTAARQTALARQDESAIVDTIEQSRDELRSTLDQLSSRASPAQLLAREMSKLAADPVRRTRLVTGAVLAAVGVIVLRRRPPAP